MHIPEVPLLSVEFAPNTPPERTETIITPDYRSDASLSNFC